MPRHKSSKSKTKSTGGSKKCPHCGSSIKKIKGKNVYFCKEHGFVSASKIGQKSTIRRILSSVGL